MRYLFAFLFLVSFHGISGGNNTELEFKKRVIQYGLISQKDYDPQIIQELQDDIKSSYIPKVESVLGSCSDSSCMIHNESYYAFKTASQTICLPYTECGFYECMEEKYQCSKVGVNYFKELAEPTCKQYKKDIERNKFSQLGHDWIYSVMVCLQKGLIDECELLGKCDQGHPKKTCNYITDFTLKFHPGCYVNSGVGVCHLPLRDKIQIWKTVGKFLTRRERQEAFKVILSCINND